MPRPKKMPYPKKMKKTYAVPRRRKVRSSSTAKPRKTGY